MGWIRDLLGKNAKGGVHRQDAAKPTKPATLPKGRASKVTNLGRGKAFGGWDPNSR